MTFSCVSNDLKSFLHASLLLEMWAVTSPESEAWMEEKLSWLLVEEVWRHIQLVEISRPRRRSHFDLQMHIHEGHEQIEEQRICEL